MLRCYAIAFLAAALTVRAETDVSFVRDVMPVLSKANCNGGGCHGHGDGKGGFKLTLWGDFPARDHKAILSSPKRANLKDVDASRLLLKPTGQLEHEGGRRFDTGSPEYAILHRWLAAGAPNDTGRAPALERLSVTAADTHVTAPTHTVQLRVEAKFADGETRDVTRWAVYSLSNLAAEISAEGLVTFSRAAETTVIVRYLDQRASIRVAMIPDRPGFAWAGPPERNFIDTVVFEKLRDFRTNPSALCDDTTFLRRAFFDLIGTLPTAGEARAFVADPDPDKRTKLVDRLLQRPEFAQFWALKWSDLLRNEEKVLDRKGVDTFHGWIRDSIAQGKPIDRFARELIVARGSTYENPPANYYRALRDPADRAEATAQVFLGSRLRCAKCHNHPFDRWKQDEYYAFAALFDGIDYEILKNDRKDKFDKHQFVGEQVVKLVDERKFQHPTTKKPPSPGLLGEEAPPLRAGEDRFEQLAQWVTSPDNALFAKVQANRIWYHLMGRGIVDPVDDFRQTNPPSNPALLEALARDFVDSGFDLRALIRRITASSVYQLGAEPNGTNTADEHNFSRATVRRLEAEPLLDAILLALDVPAKFTGYGDDTDRALEVRGVRREKKTDDCDEFLLLFGKPERLINSDMERMNDTSLNQVFALTSGETIDKALGRQSNRLGRLASAERSAAETLDELFWNFLSRPPTAAESAAMLPLLENPGGRRASLEDIAWALINSKEFLFRR